MKCPRCRETFTQETQEDIDKYEEEAKKEKETREHFKQVYANKIASIRWQMNVLDGSYAVSFVLFIVMLMIFGGKLPEEITTQERVIASVPAAIIVVIHFIFAFIGDKKEVLFKKFKIERGYES